MTATDPPSPLIGVDELAAVLDAPDVVVCDVRWYLTDPERGRAEYLTGHLPGAVFVDLHHDLAGRDGGGRHPLPTTAAFGQVLERLGVSPSDTVVVYDASGGAMAARLWWMLRSIGHRSVRVLDGGVPAWIAAGHLVTDVVSDRTATTYPVPPRWTGVVDADDVLALATAGITVVDARAAERYRGETEPVDLRAGHIPGAINLPHLDHLGPDGRHRSADELRARFASVGPDAVVYCGSGVTACHDLLAMALAGITDARLYAGSWSDWSSDPARPVAVGDEPSIGFRRLRRNDFGALATWLSRPHVERWWQHRWTDEAIEADFGAGVDGTDPVEYFVIVLEGRDIGLVQRYRYGDEDDWMHVTSVTGVVEPDMVGIDYLIGEVDLTNRGIGTAVIRHFVTDTWRRHQAAPAIVVDVDPQNRPSWRVLERNGFTRVWEGVLESPDPRDAGPCWFYRLDRPAVARAGRR